VCRHNTIVVACFKDKEREAAGNGKRKRESESGREIRRERAGMLLLFIC